MRLGQFPRFFDNPLLEGVVPLLEAVVEPGIVEEEGKRVDEPLVSRNVLVFERPLGIDRLEGEEADRFVPNYQGKDRA